MATILDANNKSSTITLSGSNLVATSTGAGEVAATRSLQGPSYFEAVITTLAGTPAIGLSNQTYDMSVHNLLGSDINSIGYRSGGTVVANSVTLATLAAYVQGNRIDVAVDPAMRLIWFRVAGGNWNNNVANNPATGVGGIDYSSVVKAMFPAVGASITGTVWTTKFSTAFTGTPPAGFSSVDTVQVPVVKKSGERFKADSITIGPTARLTGGKRTYRTYSPSSAITTVNGTVKENGVAVLGKKVWLYDRLTGELIGCATSAADGTWSCNCVGRPTVLVVCSDPTTYNSIVYDNVVPA